MFFVGKLKDKCKQPQPLFVLETMDGWSVIIAGILTGLILNCLATYPRDDYADPDVITSVSGELSSSTEGCMLLMFHFACYEKVRIRKRLPTLFKKTSIIRICFGRCLD